MSEPVRCPACGASNAAGASWCGQCLTRFDSAAAGAAEAGPAASAAAPAAAAAGPAVPAPAPLRSVASEGVHRRGEDLVWTCPTCAAVNEMSHTACPVCATPIAVLFGATKRGSGPARTGPMVIVLSAVLPGAGHGYAGRAADAIARGVLFVWTTAIGILLPVSYTHLTLPTILLV